MTREDLIKSDEYIVTNVECIIISKNNTTKTRKELIDFIKEFRDELLLLKNTHEVFGQAAKVS
jgi:hypothetical protein